MRLTCAIGLALALLSQPVAVAAARGAEGTSAWTPGLWTPAAERRYARTLDELRLRETSRPGEYRLVGDGIHRFDHLRGISITADGTFWVLRAARPSMVFRVGKPGGWSAEDGMRGARDVVSTPSGTAVLVKGQRFGILDDGRWRWSARWPTDFPGLDVLVMDDGTAWAAHWERLAHFDGSTWKSWSIDDLGVTFTLPFGEGAITGLGVTPDGSVWAGLTDRDARPAGLTRFDGQGWAEVTPFEGDERIAVTALDVGADGTLWAVLVPDHDHARAHLARWDGDSWAAWNLPSTLGEGHGSPYGLQAAPDGRVWMRLWADDPMRSDRSDYSDRIVFDGQTWTRLDIRGDDDLSFAPDGGVWVSSHVDGGHDIFMVDTSRFEPVAVEAAQAYTPGPVASAAEAPDA